ncbi:MAG: TIGR04282 family arsenosugar biosynthesis glycosyltransferase [Desulfarculaceae bacterium]|nr:TIGR04282 family arsenosugar biosynthesis glycosyltransferase [Desulfarculaceae bacterium]MCF8072489.1 TIGR04282 family arsenosugar biosynthesis glycosyltransferase [Desulfarculaceae bacterium]MCF8102950.1 TIGR04282 family arsenosugar biosynthesis glycosyltransferase [Desulfarculaceae bacterium]MCF8117030.1 TIGR04282 family arsenosugar biosynthesis glycosyltransferase [Desulfarculaceae bacterium]
MKSMKTTLPRVIIFTRLPVAGQVKTRLIPALGAGGAAALQERLGRRLAHRLGTQALAAPYELEVCYTGGRETQAREWLGAALLCHPQGPGDQGARMLHALHRALVQGAPRVVLVGSDLPGLTGENVSQALAALEDAPLVLGPSPDGGYYLIGLSRLAPGLLDPPAWESLAGVQGRAAELGLKAALLPAQRDLDTPEDLDYWREKDPELFS